MSKKALRVFLVIVAACTVFAMVSGCGGTKKESTAKPEPPKTEVKPEQQQAAPPQQTEAKSIQLKMMTGSTGGIWYPTGAAMAEFWKKDIPGLSVSVAPGGGISNLVAVDQGDAELGFSKAADAVVGFAGEEPFKEKLTKVRNIAYLSPESTQIVVLADSKINRIEDIKGKRLTTATKGTSTEQVVSYMLKAYGMSWDDFRQVHYVNFTDSVNQLKDGKADVWIVCTPAPASTVIDLSTARKIRFLEIPDDKIQAINKMNPGYFRQEITKKQYEFIEKSVQTIGTALNLSVKQDLSTDLVYEMTKSIVKNLDAIRSSHVAYEDLTKEDLAKDIGIPLHDGAARYYREIGILPK